MRILAVLLLALGVLIGFFFFVRTGRPPASTAHVEREAPPRPDPTGTASLAEPRVVEEEVAESAPRRAAEPEPRSRPTAENTAARRLFGAVIAEAGPLPGAQLRVFAAGRPLAEGDTDGQGRFELSFPVPAADVVVRFTARGYAPRERALGDQAIAGQQFLGNVRLARGTVLEGVVLDERKIAVADAEVRLGLSSPAGWDGSGSRWIDTTKTGPNGRFRFHDAPSGRIVLKASGGERGERSVELSHRAGTEVTIELARPSTLRLRLVETDGDAVVGVLVAIQSLEPGEPRREGRTDENGRCVFEGLGAREWRVRVSGTGYRPTGLPNAVADGSEVVLEVTSWPCITGRVVTPGGEAPPRDTTVYALPGGTRGDLAPTSLAGTMVDADGRFRLCELRGGTYVVRARAPGYALTFSRPIRVTSEDVDAGSIPLENGGGLLLTLVVDGEPADGIRADVLRTPPAPAQLWIQRPREAPSTATSDAQGELRLENLFAGEIWVVLRGEETVPVVRGPFRVEDELTREPAPIALQRGARIHGHVHLAGGTPVPNARVVVSGSISIPPILTDGEGRYTTPPLPKGSYTLHAMAVWEGASGETERQDVAVRDQKDRELDLVLKE